MRTFWRKNFIAIVLLLAGLVAACILCGVRIGLEAKNTKVCAVMAYDDLARLDGAPVGVRGFDGGAMLDGVWLLVEDENQHSHVPIDYNAWDGRGHDDAFVRCLYLYPQYAARYGTLGYPGAEEIENLLYRAVTDRNIRVLWLTPFTDNGEVVTDPAVYEEILQNLAARIARQGLAPGDTFSAFTREAPPLLGLFFTLLGVFGAGLLLLQSFWHVPRWLAFFSVVCLPALWFAPALTVSAGALAAAVVFPCLALWYVTARLAVLEPRGLLFDAGRFLLTLCTGIGICLLGGVFIGALQSSTPYLLAMENFRGVKLSQTLPVAYGAYIVFRRLYGRAGIRDILAGKKTLLLAACALLLAALAYYLLRTGNAAVGVWEQRFRNFLERVLLVRPRTKEFLAAWPCLAVACALILRGARRWAWPFAIVSAVGFASVVNSFCHARTPLCLSLARTVYGLVPGAVLGIAILLILYKRYEPIGERSP